MPIVAGCLLLTWACVAGAADWPQFRGPERDGVSPETNLLDAWPAGGPRRVWQIDAGVGGGSCAVVGDYVYVLGALPDPNSDKRKPPRRDTLLCLRRDDGRRLWQTPIGEYTRERTYHSPHVTPTVTDDGVYVASRTGRAVCCDRTTGEIRWQVETAELMGGADHAHYGYSCSPLVLDGKVYLFSRYGAEGLGPELLQTMLSDEQRARLAEMDPAKRPRFFWGHLSSLLAFDAGTGKLLWRTRPMAGAVRSDLASPIQATMAGRAMILWPTGSQLIAVCPGTGEVLWHFDYAEQFGLDKIGPSHSACTPLIWRDRVIDQLWNHRDTNRTYCLRITEAGPELVWNTTDLTSWYHSFVVVDDMLLGLDNQGIVKGRGPALPGTRPAEIGMLQAYDIADGRRLWHTDEFGPIVADGERQIVRPGYIAADGKLIIQGTRGVSLLAVDRQGAHLRGVIDHTSGDRAYALPSLSDGYLFIREVQGPLHCFDIRADARATANRPGE